MGVRIWLEFPFFISLISLFKLLDHVSMEKLSSNPSFRYMATSLKIWSKPINCSGTTSQIKGMRTIDESYFASLNRPFNNPAMDFIIDIFSKLSPSSPFNISRVKNGWREYTRDHRVVVVKPREAIMDEMRSFAVIIYQQGRQSKRNAGDTLDKREIRIVIINSR
jgi:hypothetical protein